MKHASLFSGIGGFDLAAEWVGWENVFHCEINEFGRKVLHHYWPNAIQYSDIKTTDFKAHANTIDILTGGFPCQPYSTAGKRLGKEDDRHLWPEMLRAIREIQPGWVVGENVRGLTNWNGGVVFDEVQADLEAEGYEVLPFLLPACAVNTPHRRDRIWFVAHSVSDGHGNRLEESGREKKKEQATQQRKERDEILRKRDGNNIERVIIKGIVTNTKEQRFQKRDAESVQFSTHTTIERYCSISQWKDFPTVSPIHNRDDGVFSRLASFTVPTKRGGFKELTRKQSIGKWRAESIKAAGNAIVPQVVYEIFKAIEKYDAA
jgi:DNA (cytosine-5)-methyltransferase 1